MQSPQPPRLLDQVRQSIEQLFTQTPDADLFATLPGAGEHLAPRLLLAFGEERTRFTSAQDLMQYAGIAPVTERSGQKDWVHWQASPGGGFPSVGNWRAGLAPSFYARALWSHGNTQRRSMNPRNAKARRTRRQFGHWRLSGLGLSGVAGKMSNRMMR